MVPTAEGLRENGLRGCWDARIKPNKSSFTDFKDKNSYLIFPKGLEKVPGGIHWTAEEIPG